MDSQGRIKIALFTDILEENFDGVSVTLHKILKSAPQERFEFLVITPHPPTNLTLIPHKMVLTRFVKLPFQKGYRLGLPGKSIRRALNDFCPDLLHFTSPSLLGAMAVRYGKRKNIPVMNIYHTHYPAYIKYYIGDLGDFLFGDIIKRQVLKSYAKSDLTLVPTHPIQKDLVELGVPESKMMIWGRAIETGSYSPAYRNESIFDDDIPRNHKKVLFVSRLIKEKDMGLLLRIYKKLRKTNKKITLIVTGEGPRRPWLEKRMKHAVFTGKRVGSDLAQLYSSSDVFLFPSSSETFGNVVIEAMASGLPVVAADAGGPAEIIQSGKNGFLVKPGKAKKFVKQIAELVENAELHRSVSEKAREAIRNRSLDSLHEHLWKIYEQTAEGNRAPSALQSASFKSKREPGQMEQKSRKWAFLQSMGF